MDLNRLYHWSLPLDRTAVGLNKYTFWASRYKLPYYRLVTLGTLISMVNENKENTPLDHITRFVDSEGRVLAIFNVIEGQVSQVVLRSLREHKFISLTSSHQYMYGVGMVSKDKVYSDPVVLTEGTIDRDVLITVYPYVFGCLTSGLSKLNTELMKYITNHVILAYDNDEVGQKAIRRDRWALQNAGLRVSVLNHMAGHKDPGDVAQALYEGRESEANLALSFYRVAINRLKGE